MTAAWAQRGKRSATPLSQGCCGSEHEPPLSRLCAARHAAPACGPAPSRPGGQESADGALADFTKTIEHVHGSQPAPPPAFVVPVFPPLLPPTRPSTTSTSWDSDRGCRDAEASRLPGATRRRRHLLEHQVLHWDRVGGGVQGGDSCHPLLAAGV